MPKTLCVLQIIWLLCACANRSSPSANTHSKLYFPQRKSPPPGQDWPYPAALATGTLSVDGKCIRLKFSDDPGYLIVWHPDARLVEKNDSIQIESGDVAYKIGDKVKLGGGGYEVGNVDFVSTLTREPLPKDCPGQIWLASGIEADR